MMGVSTRNVKYKFSEGEKVLCYEPDPTKAKVLYESKVLGLHHSYDDYGHRITTYLIHFCGWNSSWDRYVGEELILHYTDENKELQKKLTAEADSILPHKRKRKQLKEILKQQTAENESSNSRPDSSQSSSDDESPEREIVREVSINIPDDLKKELEEDWKNITKKNKLVKLPCQPNVVAILEAFVKHLAAKLLCVSPPKNSKNGRQHIPGDVQNKLNLCKEAMDGIRIYFDFTLPHLLLYHQERLQYSRDATTCSPVSNSSIDLLCDTRGEACKEELSLKKELSLNDATSDCQSPLRKPKIEHSVNSVQKVRPDLRNGRILQGNTNKKTPKLPDACNSQKLPRGRPRTLPTRNLRSIDKNKQTSTDLPIHENSLATSETKPSLSCSQTPNSGSSVIPGSTPERHQEIRVTRKSLQQNVPPVSLISSPPQSSHVSLAEGEDPTFPFCSHVPDKVDHINPSTSRILPEELSSPSTSSEAMLQSFQPSTSLTSNCVTSSNSSSHSTFSNSKRGQEYQLIKNESLLKDIMAWHLLPKPFYVQKPAAPCLIYGAQHLLRLFVKLPEMISKMNMSRQKLSPLVSILESFLKYMSDQKDILFVPSAYVDSCDD